MNSNLSSPKALVPRVYNRYFDGKAYEDIRKNYSLNDCKGPKYFTYSVNSKWARTYHKIE